MILQYITRRQLTLSSSPLSGSRNGRTSTLPPWSTLHTLNQDAFAARADHKRRPAPSPSGQIIAPTTPSFPRRMSLSAQDMPTAQVAGNASQETKQACLAQFIYIIGARSRACFGQSVGRRLRLSRIDVRFKPEAPTKKEATVICEITVEPDMVNVIGSLHGGCSAFLIDDCSSLPLIVLGHELCKNSAHGVSQNITIYYHAPTFVGSELQIISTSLSYGARVMSSRCEIWDKTNKRLVASGVHTMMQPSPSRTAA